jgi:hypothetical protein
MPNQIAKFVHSSISVALIIHKYKIISQQTLYWFIFECEHLNVNCISKNILMDFRVTWIEI